MLELGRHIVSQLQLHDRGDWLRHWLAHHIAELIRDAETAASPRDRRSATKSAAETILKLWAQRTDLPGEVNPLAQYREALRALLAIKPDHRRWLGSPGRNLPDAAASVYRRFPQLMEVLVLLPSVRANKSDARISAAVKKFLTNDENRLLNELVVRISLTGINEDDGGSESKSDFERFEEKAEKLIDETIKDLQNIRQSGRQKKSGRLLNPAVLRGLPKARVST